MRRLTPLLRSIGCLVCWTTGGAQTRRVHCASGFGGGACGAPLRCFNACKLVQKIIECQTVLRYSALFQFILGPLRNALCVRRIERLSVWLWNERKYFIYSYISKKGRHQTHSSNSVNSRPVYHIFPLSDSPVYLQQ